MQTKKIEYEHDSRMCEQTRNINNIDADYQDFEAKNYNFLEIEKDKIQADLNLVSLKLAKETEIETHKLG